MATFSKKKVIIVGAGAAGLQTALSLHKDFDVEILEASNCYGGRVRTDFTFADIPIELGGEEIAGENSLHYKYAKQMDISMIDENELTLYVDVDGSLQRAEDVDNVDIHKALDFSKLIKEYDSKEDISVIHYLDKLGYANEIKFILENQVGREWGANLHSISMKSLHEYYTKNTLGDRTYFLKEFSQYDLLTWKFEPILQFVQLNTPVKKIDYSKEGKVFVIDEKLQQYECDYVVICVPLSILKGSFIDFVPSLPNDKQTALQVLSMEAGAKLVMKFTERFWPADLKNTLQDDMFNYIWSPTNARAASSSHVLTALIVGKDFYSFSLMTDEEVKETIFSILTKFGKSKEDIQKLFIDYKITNWLSEPFIKGIYSNPGFDYEGSKYREIMMHPLEDKVFFAGEAFNKENFSTIGSALQSGLQAAQQIRRIKKALTKINPDMRLKANGLNQLPQQHESERRAGSVAQSLKSPSIVLSLDYKTLKILDMFNFALDQ